MPRVSKRKGKAATSKKQSTFILTGEHKIFLTKRADEHAEATQQEKLKIVALAIQELLAEHSITCKEDIRKADKVCFISETLLSNHLHTSLLGDQSLVLRSK